MTRRRLRCEVGEGHDMNYNRRSWYELGEGRNMNWWYELGGHMNWEKVMIWTGITMLCIWVTSQSGLRKEGRDMNLEKVAIIMNSGKTAKNNNWRIQLRWNLQTSLHCRLVFRRWKKRGLILVSGIQQEAYNEDTTKCHDCYNLWLSRTVLTNEFYLWRIILNNKHEEKKLDVNKVITISKIKQHTFTLWLITAGHNYMN